MQTPPNKKNFKWDEEKNARLKIQRGISFELIVGQITQGEVLDVYDHPNQQKYRGQRIFVVQTNDYAWLVQFVESDDEIFLKTIIPSRKITKQYLRGSS